MKNILLLTGLLTLNSITGSDSQAAGIDCASTRSILEIIICADPALTALNSEEIDLYNKLRASAPEAQKKDILKQQQKFWKERTNICKIPRKPSISEEESNQIITCLKVYYTMRINELKTTSGLAAITAPAPVTAPVPAAPAVPIVAPAPIAAAPTIAPLAQEEILSPQLAQDLNPNPNSIPAINPLPAQATIPALGAAEPAPTLIPEAKPVEAPVAAAPAPACDTAATKRYFIATCIANGTKYARKDYITAEKNSQDIRTSLTQCPADILPKLEQSARNAAQKIISSNTISNLMDFADAINIECSKAETVYVK